MLYDLLMMIPVWWFLGELIGYLVHKGMHWFFVSAHEEHHMILYPPTDFYSEDYRGVSGKSSWGQNLYYGIPGSVFALAIFFLLGWQHLLVFLGVVVVIAFKNQYVHDTMHIIGHWTVTNRLTRRYFKYLRHRHFIHHVDLHKNLGMYHFVWDIILRTKEKKVRRGWRENSPWANREKERLRSADVIQFRN